MAGFCLDGSAFYNSAPTWEARCIAGVLCCQLFSRQAFNRYMGNPKFTSETVNPLLQHVAPSEATSGLDTVTLKQIGATTDAWQEMECSFKKWAEALAKKIKEPTCSLADAAAYMRWCSLAGHDEFMIVLASLCVCVCFGQSPGEGVPRCEGSASG